MKNILRIKNLNISFQAKNKIHQVVTDISFAMNEGEIVGIVGESGCGKSMTALSLLRLLPENARLDTEEIIVDGININGLDDNALRKIRGKDISIIFQEPMSSLNPLIKVGKQVSESVREHRGLSRKEAKKKALEMMSEVGLPNADVLYDRLPHQLSGGMQQRIMIALAMICNPKILIADEPTTALDVTIQAQILYLMKELNKKHGTSILFISHDLGVISQMCQTVIVMYLGHIVEKGSVKTVLTKPAHPYTHGLIKCLPDTSKKVEKLYTIIGHVPDMKNASDGCPFEPRCFRSKERCKTQKPELSTFAEGHDVRCFYPIGSMQDGGIV